MDENEIYCRKCARQRLQNRGLSPSEAFMMAEKVYKDVKEIIDKHAKL